MERRRFIPRSEGLEGRELLSTAGIGPVGNAHPAVVANVANLPDGQAPRAENRDASTDAIRPTAAMTRVPAEAYQTATPTARARRLVIDPNDPNISPLRKFKIERLPNLLESVHRGRYIPPEIISALQDDLTAIQGTLRPPPSPALQAFNLQVRSTLSHASVSVEDAAALNRIFGLVLARSGATADIVEKFQADMLALTHVDVQERSPALVLANDYTVILQTTMGVGINFQPYLSATSTQGLKQAALRQNALANGQALGY